MDDFWYNFITEKKQNMQQNMKGVKMKEMMEFLNEKTEASVRELFLGAVSCLLLGVVIGLIMGRPKPFCPPPAPVRREPKGKIVFKRK